MKRIRVIILILLIVFMSVDFCGCSESSNSSDNGKFKYYAYYQDSLCDIIRKYNKYCKDYYDESYQIEIIMFDTQEEMNLKMSTEVMSGGGPDIFSLGQNLPFEKLSANKTIADINELIDLYDYDIGLSDCKTVIMDAGVIGGKRYFIPLSYSPDVFITTEETLKKYNLSSSEFSYKALSDQLISSKDTYSLFGSTYDNTNFFYSFLNQYFDYNNGNTGFNTDEFSENLDCIYNLISNDSTNENTYYFLYENINNGASILYNEFPSFYCMVRTYAFLYYLGGTPALINNFNKIDSTVSSSVDLGIGINNNCKNKEKLLTFIRYCLSEDVQINTGIDNGSLPVNINALDYFIDKSDKTIDFDDDGYIDENEKTIFKKARDAALKDYIYIIDNTSECKLYSFYNFSETYFNSSVIGDIVNKYLEGDISKEKFIRQLTAATEIYLTE